MGTYDPRLSTGVCYDALSWEAGQHDPRLVRDRVTERIREGTPVHCVWTDADLRRRQFAVDHCFPWSRWGNNDLWNLLPTTPRANNQKAERLPAPVLLSDARDRITEWWQ